MLFGEKANIPAGSHPAPLRRAGPHQVTGSGAVAGQPCLSTQKPIWRRFRSVNPEKGASRPSTIADGLKARDFAADVRGLLDTLSQVRRRILANTLLHGGTKWFVWVLAGLVAVAMVSSKLAGSVTLIGILAGVSAVLLVAGAWGARASFYEAARRLDAGAGLRDRISTAIYLGRNQEPEEMIRKQRQDALDRIAKVDARSLFPIRLPANVGRAGVLILVVAGLFAYRMHHQAPLVSLLRNAARSQFAQSVLAPMVRAMEKDLERAAAMITTKPDAAGDEARGDAGSANDDPWKGRNDNEAAAKEDQQNSIGQADSSQEQLQASDQQADPSGEAGQENGEAQSQEGQNGGDASGKAQQRGDSQGSEGRQSLGQSLMQALKNMLSGSQGQQANSRSSQQPSGQGMPQTGNSHQPGSTDSDKRGESRGSSDAKQKATQTASEGAGNQPGSKELRKDQEARPVNAVPDRVALESSGFKEKTRMNVATETGAAQLAVRDESLKGDAVTNGAEQENIPARYRLYIQRYFEHADSEKH